jgi:hypothetical protein
MTHSIPDDSLPDAGCRFGSGKGWAVLRALGGFLAFLFFSIACVCDCNAETQASNLHPHWLQVNSSGRFPFPKLEKQQQELRHKHFP